MLSRDLVQHVTRLSASNFARKSPKNNLMYILLKNNINKITLESRNNATKEVYHVDD